MYNADGSGKLLPLVNVKHKMSCCFKNIKRLPTKYGANTYSWMTIKISEDYLLHLDRKLGAKNHKIFVFVGQCTAHPKNTTFLSSIRSALLSINSISHP
jgi:hypothetical protein